MNLSLRTQLNIGLGVILAAGFGIQWALRSEALPAITESQMVSRLNQDIDDISESLKFDQHDLVSIEVESQLPFYRRIYSGHYYRIESGRQVMYSPSMGMNRIPKVNMDGATIKRWHTTGPEAQPLLMLTRQLVVSGHEVQISVGEDLTTLNRHITEIGSLILMLNGAIIFLALVLQWVFVRNALNPYVFLKKELETITSPLEFKDQNATNQLVDAREMKRLVALVHQRLDRSRNAIGNLAHALKTPLSLLMRMAEDERLSVVPGIQARLGENLGAMHHIIDSELRRARIAGRGPTGNVLNLRDETQSLLSVIEAMYKQRALSFQIDAPDLAVKFDRHDFLELLGNLADNAAKWARTRVAVKVSVSGARLLLVVEDDGVGCDREAMMTLTHRGVRLDEEKGGYGLGLSIVKDLVVEYDGIINFSSSDQLGGLKVSAAITLGRY